MSLTQKELGLIRSNYRNYKSEYEATKTMPRVLAYVRELEGQVAELKAAAKRSPPLRSPPLRKRPQPRRRRRRRSSSGFGILLPVVVTHRGDGPLRLKVAQLL